MKEEKFKSADNSYVESGIDPDSGRTILKKRKIMNLTIDIEY